MLGFQELVIISSYCWADRTEQLCGQFISRRQVCVAFVQVKHRLDCVCVLNALLICLIELKSGHRRQQSIRNFFCVSHFDVEELVVSWFVQFCEASAFTSSLACSLMNACWGQLRHDFLMPSPSNTSRRATTSSFSIRTSSISCVASAEGLRS